MRASTTNTQVFTLFGGGYVAESHGRGPALSDPKVFSLAGWAAVLAVLLVGVTTAAAFTITHVVAAGLN